MARLATTATKEASRCARAVLLTLIRVGALVFVVSAICITVVLRDTGMTNLIHLLKSSRAHQEDLSVTETASGLRAIDPGGPEAMRNSIRGAEHATAPEPLHSAAISLRLMDGNGRSICKHITVTFLNGHAYLLLRRLAAIGFQILWDADGREGFVRKVEGSIGVVFSTADDAMAVIETGTAKEMDELLLDAKRSEVPRNDLEYSVHLVRCRPILIEGQPAWAARCIGAALGADPDAGVEYAPRPQNAGFFRKEMITIHVRQLAPGLFAEDGQLESWRCPRWLRNLRVASGSKLGQ